MPVANPSPTPGRVRVTAVGTGGPLAPAHVTTVELPLTSRTPISPIWLWPGTPPETYIVFLDSEPVDGPDAVPVYVEDAAHAYGTHAGVAAAATRVDR